MYIVYAMSSIARWARFLYNLQWSRDTDSRVVRDLMFKTVEEKHRERRGEIVKFEAFQECAEHVADHNLMIVLGFETSSLSNEWKRNKTLVAKSIWYQKQVMKNNI